MQFGALLLNALRFSRSSGVLKAANPASASKPAPQQSKALVLAAEHLFLRQRAAGLLARAGEAAAGSAALRTAAPSSRCLGLGTSRH